MLEPHEKHKALTRFICQELLYEFVLGKLDPDRQRAMDFYLSTDRESQHELERLRRGFVFAAQMSKTQMSDELRAALLGFEPIWKRRLAQWTAWWSRRGWKLLPYSVLAGVLILGSLVTKPWLYLTQRDVVLIEEAKHEPSATPPPANAPVQNNDVTPVKPEEREAKKAAPPIVPAVIPAPAKKQRPTLIAEESGDLLVANPQAASKPALAAALPLAVGSPPIPTRIDARIPVVAVSQVNTEPTPAGPATEAAAVPGVQADLGPATEAAKPQINLVFRGRVEALAFEAAVPAIRDKITELGGQVIGTGELGSERKKGEAYFHFSLPESKRQELEDYLKNFGPVRFGKQADKRVMPEGQNHIILTVKDVSPHEERKETETP